MIFLGIFPSAGSSYAASAAPSAPERAHTIGETFAYERMTFKAGFFLLPHAGDAEIHLAPLDKKKRYRATLTGKTRGVIAFFTRHREDTHISELKENKDGTRFICTRLIRDTRIGNSHTTKIFEMDYKKRQMTVTRLKKKRKSVHVKPIPEGVVYDDPLTAFYNFRYGCYGPIQYGSHYKIDTIPGKKIKHLYLRVAPKKETERKKSSVPAAKKVKYLVHLRISPEIIKSKKGEIDGWLSPDLIPLYGVAKDVILFGDVTGRLVNRQKDITPRPPI